MRINFAHLREAATNGGYIDFAVFEADAANRTDAGRGELLSQLTTKARFLGLKVDISALIFNEAGRMRTYGDRSVVEYLSDRGVAPWTHYLEL